MPLSDEATKQTLIFALQLVRDHDAEIARMNASLQAILNVLGEHSAEFQRLHAKMMQSHVADGSVYGPQGPRSVARSIDEMLRLIQEG
ncbi:MAG TPA: hypothetical protein VJX30_07855 [Terriglobales bacterium]|nr:hypothetical protein [Candidatus Acidoferrum sp.]HKN70927.1 hypothetical protein [Terriglobales bacterium]